jgi:hypothetical protein
VLPEEQLHQIGKIPIVLDQKDVYGSGFFHSYLGTEKKKVAPFPTSDSTQILP